MSLFIHPVTLIHRVNCFFGDFFTTVRIATLLYDYQTQKQIK